MQKMRGIVSAKLELFGTAPEFKKQIFGGAALNDDIGNTLAALGVSLHSLYGA